MRGMACEYMQYMQHMKDVAFYRWISDWWLSCIFISSLFICLSSMREMACEHMPYIQYMQYMKDVAFYRWISDWWLSCIFISSLFIWTRWRERKLIGKFSAELRTLRTFCEDEIYQDLADYNARAISSMDFRKDQLLMRIAAVSAEVHRVERRLMVLFRA